MDNSLIRKAIYANSFLWKGTFIYELVVLPEYLLWYTKQLDTLFMSSAQGLSSFDALKANLSGIEDFFKSKNKPTSIYLDPLTDTPETVEFLTQQGYNEAPDNAEVWWGIDLEEFDPEKIDTTPGLDIKPCLDRKTFDDHLQAALLGYSDFESWAVQLSEHFQNKVDGVEISHFVGYMDGKPAACSTVGHYFDFSILINTAVVPEFRRKGIHTSMMLQRLKEAKARGSKYAFYQTETDNEASIATGRKLGFTERFRRKLFTK